MANFFVSQTYWFKFKLCI